MQLRPAFLSSPLQFASSSSRLSFTCNSGRSRSSTSTWSMQLKPAGALRFFTSRLAEFRSLCPPAVHRACSLFSNRVSLPQSSRLASHSSPRISCLPNWCPSHFTHLVSRNSSQLSSPNSHHTSCHVSCRHPIFIHLRLSPVQEQLIH